eukprot:1232652-Lingulodinium_polyedra.AAC.1
MEDAARVILEFPERQRIEERWGRWPEVTRMLKASPPSSFHHAPQQVQRPQEKSSADVASRPFFGAQPRQGLQ